MNDLGREKLVQAALNGVPQARGSLFHGEARCAMGVLVGDEWLEAHNRCPRGYESKEAVRFWDKFWKEVYERYGMDAKEHRQIIRMNDTEGLDFLTIARKLGNREEA